MSPMQRVDAVEKYIHMAIGIKCLAIPLTLMLKIVTVHEINSKLRGKPMKEAEIIFRIVD